MYRPTEIAHQLQHTDLDPEMALAAPYMRDWVQNSVERRNAVIDLVQGAGEFAAAWDMPNPQGHYATGYAPGQCDVLAEALVQNQLAGKSWWSRQNAEVVRFFLARIRQNDASHPFVANWRVWAMDTIDPKSTRCPVWPEVAGT